MSTKSPRVTLYVRSLAPRGAMDSLQDVRASLGSLAEDGAIADFEVSVWGEAVPVNEDHSLSRHVGRIVEWAREREATLPGVDECDAGSLVDESRPVVTLPRIAMGEYHDGDLAVFTPHKRDGVVHTVSDRLETLEMAEPRVVGRTV